MRTRRPLLALLALALVPAPALAQGGFSPATPVPRPLPPSQRLFAEPVLAAGANPRAVAAADLDGDGVTDLAVADLDGASVAVLRGHGDGTFGAAKSFTAGPNPVAVAAGDMDADGVRDLVVAVGPNVAVLLGAGDGTFGAPTTFAAGNQPTSIEIADLDGDGAADLAVSSYIPGDVAVLLGNGDGTFAPLQSFPAGIGAVSLEVADFDHDGAEDLAVAVVAGLALLFGAGDGTFAPPQILAIAALSIPMAVGVADLDGDGHADLAVAGRRTGLDSVTVRLGNGDGTFAPGLVVPTECRPVDVAIGDLDGDGQLDLAVAGEDVLAVFVGDGSGGFAQAPSRPAADAQSLACADLNGDGADDVATARSDTGVGLLLSEGGALPDPASVSTGARAACVAGADLDGDGATDLVVANEGAGAGAPGSVSVHLGAGDGSFPSGQEYATGGHPVSVTLADFDGDGWADLVAAASSASAAQVQTGLGDGTFSFPPQSFATGAFPAAVAVADLDGDGALDLVTANRASDDVSVLLGAGDGSFAAAQGFAVGPFPVSVAASDLDGDGAPDLAVANEGDFALAGRLTTLLGAGDGTFAAAVEVPTRGAPRFVAIADLDQDGADDLAVVVASAGGGSLSVHFGTGSGGFLPALGLPATNVPRSVAAADVDGDGALDLVLGGDRCVELRLGTGRGAFAPPRRYASVSTSVAVLDLDQDGRADLVLATDQDACDPAWSVRDVWVLLNRLP